MSGCSTLFISCVSALKREPIFQRSPRGKKVHELLCHIEEICGKSVLSLGTSESFLQQLKAVYGVEVRNSVALNWV